MPDQLKKYRQKRDFKKTSEPKGKKKEASAQPIFVIQKHQARNLHYDFRLEIAGVLKSWAIPKKPSRNPQDKRLAIPTEDHPLEYAEFEGRIPKGEYGAGTVEIWDQGTYQNLGEMSLEQSLQDGHIEIDLKGKRFKGVYILHRFRAKPKKLWLLIKKRER